MTTPKVPLEVTRLQALATAPEASAWVSANAGAGKTHVLTERVVRLLSAGARPEAILCLTYTTAAAAEMKGRVFKRLATLALAEDAAIDAFLAGGGPAAPEDRARVRRLFATALDTPGGLKIQTIHAFCAALLRQFPLEANVSGRFGVLDDAARDEIVTDAIDDVLAEAARAPDGALARHLSGLLDHVPGEAVPPLLADAVARRRQVTALLQVAEDGDPAGVPAVLAQALGLGPGDTVAAIEAAIPASDAFTPERIEALCARLAHSGKNDNKLKDRFDDFRAAPAGARAERWLDVFFTAGSGDRKPRKAGSFATRAVREELAWLEEAFAAEVGRLDALHDRLRAARAVEATTALLPLAERVIAHVERQKARRGLIDYADQVDRARALLASGDAADWVRYKLDQGVDHILLDEGQDTSPDQWGIVERLAEEFFAGAGARQARRTLFVVGDGKQSIYSFQGADPAGFEAERKRYAALAAAADAPFHDVVLAHSFRSVPAVLSAVDRVFDRADLAAALFAGERAITHEAVREGVPGCVEIWPVAEAVDPEVPDDWTQPVDHGERRSGALVLAHRIADTVRGWLDAPPVVIDGKPLRPGDIMVLVRKRAGFADLMNRTFKQKGVPVAGADRLDLIADIAVKDLAALLRACLTPEDDLSLAAVLRSPLFDLSEDGLFDLAHHRTGTLSAALHSRRDEPAFGEAADRFARLAAMARGARPFDFLTEVLGPGGGRKRFLQRLGPEAAEILDALVAMALAHEGSSVPTLEAFLHRLDRSATEIKRESEGGADAVRVMTVHGAKGLEAKVVFLVDHTGPPVPSGRRSTLVDLALGGEVTGLLHVPARTHRPEAVETVLQHRQAADVDEYQRLLYVAMTRAKDRLVVCGFRGKRAPHADCWIETVRTALEGAATPVRGAAGEVVAWRWQAPGIGSGVGPRGEALGETTATGGPLPLWLHRAAEAPARLPLLRASAGLSGNTPRTAPRRPAAAGEGGDGLDALDPALRGTIVHRLFEHLADRAPAGRATAGERLLARGWPALAGAVRKALVDEAVAALAAPGVAALLAAPGLSEREVMGDVRLPDGRVARVSGRIDRLVMAPDGPTILDFKTDRAVPATVANVAPHHLEQLALYRALVAPLAGGRPVRLALLYTRGPLLLAVPASAVPAAVPAGGARASA